MKYINVIVFLFCFIICAQGTSNLRSFLGFKKNDSVDVKQQGDDNPVFDFLFGFLLFFASFPILWFNEKRHLIDQYRIEHARQQCAEIKNEEINSIYEGQLVLTSGKTDTSEVVEDKDFGLVQEKTMVLKRHVEMLQWIQHSEKVNKRTVYFYSLDWKETFYDSGNYHEPGHLNDNSKWVVEKQDFYNHKVQLGQYLLAQDQLSQTKKYENVNLHDEHISQAQHKYQSKVFNHIQLQGRFIYFKQVEDKEAPGDLRIHFTKVPCEDITVVAQQKGNSFCPFKIFDKYQEGLDEAIDEDSVGVCCYGLCACIEKLEAPLVDINWVEEQIYSKKRLFFKKANEGQMKTNLLRLSGWLAMLFGLILIFSPISYILSLFPLFGAFLAALSSFIFFLFSLLISIPLTLMTISIAWLYYRPLVGLMLLTIAGGVWYGLYYLIEIGYI